MSGLASKTPLRSQRKLEFECGQEWRHRTTTNSCQSPIPASAVAPICAHPACTFPPAPVAPGCSTARCHLGGGCLLHHLLWGSTSLLLAGNCQLLSPGGAVDSLPLPPGAGSHPLLPPLPVHQWVHGHHPSACHLVPQQRLLSCRGVAGRRSIAA